MGQAVEEAAMKRMGLLWAAVLAGCAHRGGAASISPVYTTAVYELNSPRGNLGEAHLWTRGAFVGDVNGFERTVVHVGLNVKNGSTDPLLLDVAATRLEAMTADRKFVGPLPVERMTGVAEIPAGATRGMDLYFIVPEGTPPGRLSAFRLHWQIDGCGVNLGQVSSFEHKEDERYASIPFFFSPLRDPFQSPLPARDLAVSGREYRLRTF
jgi:hypothetical protein